eukprot:g68703.t1
MKVPHEDTSRELSPCCRFLFFDNAADFTLFARDQTPVITRPTSCWLFVRIPLVLFWVQGSTRFSKQLNSMTVDLFDNFATALLVGLGLSTVLVERTMTRRHKQKAKQRLQSKRRPFRPDIPLDQQRDAWEGMEDYFF